MSYLICPQCTNVLQIEKNNKEYTENTILVEGGDDEMLLYKLMHSRGLNINKLTIEPKDGYSTIITRLKNIQSNSGYKNIEKLIVFADANSVGAQTRFQEILAQLDSTEFSIPLTLGQLSTKISGKKQFGVFLFPDNSSNGILEDLCLKALIHPQKMECINEHINCIKTKGLLATNIQDLPKSKIHIYMATSSNPTGNIGGAAKINEIDITSNQFNNMELFLKQLI